LKRKAVFGKRKKNDILSAGMNQFLLEEEKEFKKQYRFSLWWVEHRQLLKNIGLGLILVIDAVLVLVVVWGFLDSFGISYGKEQRAVAESVVYNQEDLRAYSVSRSAVALELGETRVFSLGDGRFDFYTDMQNSNEDWWAEFTYRFTYEGGETKQATGFILPNSSKPIAELAVSSATLLRDVNFVLTQTVWHRVDHKLIKDYPSWQTDHLNFLVENPTFSQETNIGDKTIGRTSFSVTNKTAFTYYKPMFVILLKKGSSVVGVNRVMLETLQTGETQNVDVNWFGTLPSVSQVEVLPDVNIFDPAVYEAPSGTSTIDTRLLPVR